MSGELAERTLRIATRGSALAMWQAQWVADRLRERAGVIVKIVEINTRGDRDRSTPLAEMGGSGVFTKEIQNAVLDGRADIAVHSMKDLPASGDSGLYLAAVPTRETTSDALVAVNRRKLADLPAGARVGTSSPRRKALLKHARPDLEVVAVRGNVGTRLRQVIEDQVDAVVLAEAGLRRLGDEEIITERLVPPTFLPAVGQGALALECRADDKHCRTVLARLDDADSRRAVTAERTLLAAMQGGCSVPLAALAQIRANGLYLSAAVLDPEGRHRIDVSLGPTDDPVALGLEAAQVLKDRGALSLMQVGPSSRD